MKRVTESDREVLNLFEDYVAEWVESTFDSLTPPQKEAWPLIANKKNTLIFSPTGSGKTLAAFLFCINELFKLSVSGNLDDTIYVLYVSPLRALSNDIHKNLYLPLRGILKILKEKSIHCPPIRARVRTGDTTSSERAQMARKPPHILITTPETLYIVLTTKKFRENLKNIQYVIIDEIHALAGSKRGVQLSLSLERLASFLGVDPIRIGLSATQSPVEEIAKFLVGMNSNGTPRECEIVDIGARKNLDLEVVSPVDNLLEAKNDVVWNSAYLKLVEMIQDHETTLIFTNSRYRTERIALQLREIGEELGLNIGSHHGSMSRLIRHDIEEKLKTNRMDAVVATSSLELGIDIGSIDLVCNVESPKSLSAGMQRIGRAGHLLKETSKGRIIATDPDDLAESAVLVKGIAHGRIDTTKISFNALDILAQQIVACAAADDWYTDELYAMVKQSYCYHSLTREDFDRTVDMLSSQVMRNIYPKIYYDRVNKKVTATRGSRNIAFRCGGAIPDVSDYHVYQGSAKIGTLDEGFVERIRQGDVFILGSQTWQMTGLDKKKVLVQRVSGVPPTIPYWGGPRPSRTYDLGLLLGKFRREMEERIHSDTAEEWLQSEYLLDRDGASAVAKYYKEQYMMLGVLPSDVHVVVETFRNELGQIQIAIHSPFGVRVNDIWGYALMVAVREQFNIQVSVATVDDGILLVVPEGVTVEPEDVFFSVDASFLKERMDDILINSPVFSSRFRHCAVRSFLILREYAGKKTPVWLQSLRAAELLEEVKDNKEFPVVKEALRESAEEAFDLPHVIDILKRIQEKEIAVTFCNTKTPSPFIHQLLLVGQFGDFGQISNEERKLRLIHLHRQVLKQLIDEDLISGLLVEKDVETLEKEVQYLMDYQKAKSVNELARIIQSLGDVTTKEVEERVLDSGQARTFLEQLCSENRVVQVTIPFAVPEQRWIPTECFSMYKAAFARQHKKEYSGVSAPVLHAFEMVGVLRNGELHYVPEGYIPDELKSDEDQNSAQYNILKNFLEHSGPVTKIELVERYGLSSTAIGGHLALLEDEGLVSCGSFVGTKDSPQWCWKRNLEELHRRSLKSLKEHVKPLNPERYVDFMLKWQHVHPETQLNGKEGVFKAVKQLQTWEEHITCWERYLLASRVSDYTPKLLDELISEEKVSFGRFNPLPEHTLYSLPRRGVMQLYCREDADFIVKKGYNTEYFEDLKRECEEIVDILKIWQSLSFRGIVTGTQFDKKRVCRAVLRLFQLGILENDSYNSVREAAIVSGMSAAWDLSHTPEEVKDGTICKNIKRKGIHVDKGKWALVLGEGTDSLLERVRQIFRRYGIVTRNLLTKEAVTPPEFVQASKVLLLRGEIREGRFIEGVDGIQYALPEAVDFLRSLQLDDTFVVVNMKDPANLYGKLFPITDEKGGVIRHAVTGGNHIVIQKGVPAALLATKTYPSRYIDLEMSILRTFPREDMIELVKTVITFAQKSGIQKRFKALRVVLYNGLEVPGSGVDQILEAFGFTRSKKGVVLPIEQMIKDFDTNLDVPDVFERLQVQEISVQDEVKILQEGDITS